MAAFYYPKSRHKRRYKPTQFKRYQSYKPFLRAEFERLCVYCRCPDTSAPSLVFAVDHYRPKSVARFESLLADYSNLYYCCNTCNSRKSDYWPQDEAAGPYVINPCEHVMAEHLRFDANSAVVEAKSDWGEYTRDLLDLNSDDLVQFRKKSLYLAKLLGAEQVKLQSRLTRLSRKLNEGLDPATYNRLVAALNAEIVQNKKALEDVSGTRPVTDIPTKKLGIDLHAA